MKTLFAELVRRQVFRVAATYAIVGWLLLQIVGLLAPNLGLPDWTVALVLVILAVGFPLAILLAWAFELTPQGAKRTVASEDRPSNPRLLDFALLGFLAVVIGISSFDTFNHIEAPETSQAEETDPSSRLAIAVLPFADMSQEGNQDWFSDGISEEIIHRLALEKNLTVVGRTSSFYFKGKNVPFEEIGRILNVGTVLEGSVRKDKNRVRITAQLIDIKTGAHRWSGTFDRELKDIFRIQDELSVSITRELLRELGMDPSIPEVKPYEPNVQAYQVYLRANQVYYSFKPQFRSDAFRLYRRAAEIDPHYVRPFLGMLSILAFHGDSWSDAHADGAYDPDTIVVQALTRNPSTTELLLLKALSAAANWRFIEADRFYRDYAELTDTERARWILAAHLTWTGRSREAIPLLEEALKEDPLNGARFVVLNFAYQATGRYADVISLTDRAFELGLPAAAQMLFVKAKAAITLDDKATYERTKNAAAKVFGVNVNVLYWRMWDAQIGSDRDALKDFKNELIKQHEETDTDYLSALLAAVCGLLGEEEAALKWYRIAAETRSQRFQYDLMFPREVPILLSTAEGQALIEQAGYDPTWFDESEVSK